MPITKVVDAEELADFFFECWVMYKGFPWDILIDRRSVFQTLFWQHIMRKTGVNKTITTTWLSEGDNHSERLNSILNIYMRTEDQLQWPKFLPLAELCYNTVREKRKNKVEVGGNEQVESNSSLGLFNKF